MSPKTSRKYSEEAYNTVALRCECVINYLQQLLDQYND